MWLQLVQSLVENQPLSFKTWLNHIHCFINGPLCMKGRYSGNWNQTHLSFPAIASADNSSVDHCLQRIKYYFDVEGIKTWKLPLLTLLVIASVMSVLCITSMHWSWFHWLHACPGPVSSEGSMRMTSPKQQVPYSSLDRSSIMICSVKSLVFMWSVYLSVARDLVACRDLNIQKPCG